MKQCEECENVVPLDFIVEHTCYDCREGDLDCACCDES